MGWSGGTDIFNHMYEEFEKLRKRDELDEYNELHLLKVLIQNLWNLDWDTEDDSVYWNRDHRLVMDALGDLDPELWEVYMDSSLDESDYINNLRKLSPDQEAERRAEQRAEDWITGFDRGDY